VTAVDRGRYTVLVGEGVGGRKLAERVVTAMKARELGRKGIVVGDEVELVGDTSGGPDSLARIVKLSPRKSVLRRTADDTDPVERVIVANPDQLVIVSALANPEPRPRLIDRCLVAAYDAGLDPLLVLTKADLQDPSDFLANYAPLEVPYVVTSTSGDGFDGLEALQDKLIGRVSVFVGHSGVGKSTLVNGLTGGRQATAAIRELNQRGRHTTTTARWLDLPEGGAVIDMPGVRSFALPALDAHDLGSAFPEIAALRTGCRFADCRHAGEAGCAVEGAISGLRLESYRKLLEEQEGLQASVEPR
jgi:ribosome biogenesis GTPase